MSSASQLYIYLDESGDLGFGQGGSKYFTIAIVVTMDPLSFSRTVKNIKIKYKIPRMVELKGSTTRNEIKRDLLIKLAKLDIEIHSITVKKSNVIPKLRTDTNILYNYMVGLLVPERIILERPNTKVCIDADCRIVSITSGFKFNDYLKYKIWYEAQRPDIELEICQKDSRRNYAIQGVDVICNSIFRRYNYNSYELYNMIKGRLKTDKRLFFGK